MKAVCQAGESQYRQCLTPTHSFVSCHKNQIIDKDASNFEDSINIFIEMGKKTDAFINLEKILTSMGINENSSFIVKR